MLTIFVTTFLLTKTFYFLRVLDGFSYLVKMIEQVAYDLRIFLIFYFILMWFASLALSIVQLGNFDGHLRMEHFRGDFKEDNYPGIEY